MKYTIVFYFRNMRLQREFLPQYGYDHSEAEMFDGYTQYAEGIGSIERLGTDNPRLKVSLVAYICIA